MIEVNYRDTVAIVRLNRGITNALNLECVDELTEVFQQVKTDSQVRGMVLCATNEKFFSIGFDIPQLYGLSEGDFPF